MDKVWFFKGLKVCIAGDRMAYFLKATLLLFNFPWMLHEICCVCNQQMLQAGVQAEENGFNVAISRPNDDKVMPKR